MRTHLKKLRHSKTVTTGLAMFSMFFGAGNIVFPLVVGQHAQSHTSLAIFGLLLTAILVPFTGLLAMLLYDGDPKAFFSKMGRLPGAFVATCILGLIGPFGGMPRCIGLAYSTLQTTFPSLTLPIFSLGSCLLIFVCTYRRRRIVDILGQVLTPLLLICLTAIAVLGLINFVAPTSSPFTPGQAVLFGLSEGYNTMDLLASFFFSTVVMTGLRSEDDRDHKMLFRHGVQATLLGAGLLAAIYLAFSLVAAGLGAELANVRNDQLLGAVSLHVLGPYAGVVASCAIALTCLTTTIALASVFAGAVQRDVFKHRVSYIHALILTLAATCVTSTLEFTAIVTLLAPLLKVMYPALIALTIVNMGHKLLGWPAYKWPVYTTFAISLALQMI